MADPRVTTDVAVVKPVRGGRLGGGPGGGTHSFSASPNNWESDEAIDIMTPVGTPVFAVTAGTIGSQIGTLTDSILSRFAGIRLHLQTAGDEFYYAHLSSLAPGIEAGSHVEAGQLLGYTGSAAGVPHLHFAELLGYPDSSPSAPIWRFAPGSPLSQPPASAPKTNAQADAAAATGSSTGSSSGSQGAVANSSQCEAMARQAINDVLDGKITTAECTARLNAAGCQGSCTATGWSDLPGVGAVKDLQSALAFLFSIRFLEILGGGLLILLGISLLGKQLGVNANVPGVPGV